MGSGPYFWALSPLPCRERQQWALKTAHNFEQGWMAQSWRKVPDVQRRILARSSRSYLPFTHSLVSGSRDLFSTLYLGHCCWHGPEHHLNTGSVAHPPPPHFLFLFPIISQRPAAMIPGVPFMSTSGFPKWHSGWLEPVGLPVKGLAAHKPSSLDLFTHPPPAPPCPCDPCSQWEKIRTLGFKELNSREG